MKVYEERTMTACGEESVRRFIDIDGLHYKWIFFSLCGHEYPIGSGDIICRHEIDWENTSEVAKS